MHRPEEQVGIDGDPARLVAEDAEAFVRPSQGAAEVRRALHIYLPAPDVRHALRMREHPRGLEGPILGDLAPVISS